LIAPDADPSDGLIEFVRWAHRPAGTAADICRACTTLAHQTSLASRRAVRHVEFKEARLWTLWLMEKL